MPPTVGSMVAVTYVRDIDESRAFYALIGFHERSAGKAAHSAWSSLHHGDHSVLLASTRPPLAVPKLPLLFYFFVDDLDAVVDGFRAAGIPAVRGGHPPHALGGEVKLLDPDGNTVLLGQKERSPGRPAVADEEPSPEFSLLREAAALVASRGGTTVTCEIRDLADAPCERRAEVKLADSWGDTAWACIAHAERVLILARGTFIASEDEQGLGAFLGRNGG